MKAKPLSPVESSAVQEEREEVFVSFLKTLGEIAGKHTGIEFKGKETLIRSRLMRRVRQLKLNSVHKYVEHFRKNREQELPEIISLLTTHKTEFFRENEHFTYLYQHVFPKLILAGLPIRIWSAGSSTGEEVYSIAITFLELMRSTVGLDSKKINFQILGTDIDSKCIQTAREGVYPVSSLKNLQPAVVERYFIRGTQDLADWVKVKDEVWRNCEFKVMNLLEDENSLPRFHLVFARNLFIYFVPETMKKALEKIHQHLAEDGLLFVGLTEAIRPETMPFLSLGHSIYKKLNPLKSSKVSHTGPIRVLIVDDSATLRKMIGKILAPEFGFQVVGEAANPFEADRLLKEKQVDVMTLDIQMPLMDGVTYLKKLQGEKHPPVVMVSTIGFEEANQGLRCFELGAIDYLEKPSHTDLESKAEELRTVLRGAASSRPLGLPVGGLHNEFHEDVQKEFHKELQGIEGFVEKSLICIGASAGGPVALQNVLQRFPEHSPPILVVQHLPKFFTSAFAKKLSEICSIQVLEAVDGMPLLAGRAYIGPGGSHMGVVKKGRSLFISVQPARDGDESRHCPSVDYLFSSIAHEAQGFSVSAAILTGMGKDGSLGMKELFKAGAYTVAQNEETCVVFGMPKAAIDLGGVVDILPIQGIAAALLRGIQDGKKRAA